jgi:peroxiredoxin
MTDRRNREYLSTAGILSVVMIPILLVCIGCKKEPPEATDAGQPKPPQGPPNGLGGRPSFEPSNPESETPAARETKLQEIIEDAETWSPAFTDWFGKMAPDFTVTDITGKRHRLSDYRGKDVIVNFWATYCGACRMEIPHLIEARKAFGKDDLEIIAISHEQPQLVEKFAAQEKINYTVAASPGALRSPFGDVKYIPCTFFIDPQGRIRLATLGMVCLVEVKAILDAM